MSEEKQDVAEPQVKKGPKVTKARFTYDALLGSFPRPGGEGAHMAFYKAGALGFKAGVPKDTIIEDIKRHMKPGGRVVKDSEIEQGVTAGFTVAMEESTGIRAPRSTKPPPRLSEDAFSRIADAAKGATVESIMAKSPVPLDFPEWEAGWRTLDALYLPDDMLYIGEFRDRYAVGYNIRTASEWVDLFHDSPPTQPYIIPNPISGEQAPLKDGSGMTLRGDNNIVKFRHMVAEMDNDTIEDQLAFWSWVKLPVRALVMSGGKSIHAWVDVDCASMLEWELEVEANLFYNYMVPLRCDVLCKNESRLSRMPGHTRRADEKNPGAMQKLIWLSPEGKAVCD